MKKTILTISLFVIGIILITSSCDDNSRSLGFNIKIATVIPAGDNRYSLLLDNGKLLLPVEGNINHPATDNQRVFVNYTILSDKNGDHDHQVKVYDIWDILTKQAVELNAQNKDSIGNDPVKVNAAWIGGDYLNVSFMFNYGGVKPHAINLVRNTLSPELSPDAIDLEFRHNSYNSSQPRLYEGFVCFDLKPFRVDDADLVKFSIKVKEWNREVKYDLVYRYNQPAVETITQMPIPVISSNEYY